MRYEPLTASSQAGDKQQACAEYSAWCAGWPVLLFRCLGLLCGMLKSSCVFDLTSCVLQDAVGSGRLSPRAVGGSRHL